MKVSITQECCLRCTHCFVDKAGPVSLSPAQARSGLEIFLSSPGVNKKLEIAGGEAFLKFKLLRAVVASAEKLARLHGRELEIWVASNGLPLNDRHFRFMRRHKIVLSISLYGTAASHNAVRKLPGGRGSFSLVKGRTQAALAALPRNRVTALLCVHPDRTGSLYEDFTGLIDMGLRVVNIECVHGVTWPAQSAARFRENIDRIMEYSRRRILAGEFIVFERFIGYVKEREAGPRLACPLYRDLEVYPDGSLSLYPYGFVNVKKYARRVAIGSVSSGLSAGFSACRPGSAACATCVRDYYGLPGMRDGAANYSYGVDAVSKLFYGMVSGPDKAAFRGYIKKLIKTFG